MFFSIVSWLRRFAKVGPKSGSCGEAAAQDVDKISATPAGESDLESLKRGTLGALLEFVSPKICTTPARENDLEVKIVKTWHARSTVGI